MQVRLLFAADRAAGAGQLDAASKRAAPQGKRAYADAAKQGYLVGSARVSFPGLGHLRAQGKGCEWVPDNYSGLK